MKRFLLHRMILAFLLLFVAASNAQEKNFKGYRIFINPGHGGHDSDDRHIAATDFWESEGNLEKGLYLKKLLEKKKADVFLSRTTNTSDDDLDFDVIDEMANAANVDFFLSIHSNGGSGQINRPLMLFRGTDGQPVYPGAQVLADTLWQKVFENGQSWTHTDRYAKGDLSFYTSWGKQGLGVLRTLAVPGVLSEGSFHDFLPESRRMKNPDYLHHEAWALFRGFEAYFNIQPISEGIVAGIVRDSIQKAPSKIRVKNGDAFLPVNGACVTLMPGNRTYCTDDRDNGFYFFESVPSGTYTLYVNGTDGMLKDSATIVVQPDKTTLTDFKILSSKR
jgi:N-acetylmuramoyl-L-alanine amidase